jgi:hypothetical protein
MKTDMPGTGKFIKNILYFRLCSLVSRSQFGENLRPLSMGFGIRNI